jgi:DNA-binding transcriptional regulator LsrR (DeoR family)
LIVPGPKITAEKYPEFLRQQLAVAAANYFDDLVQNHPRGRAFHVGISGGETLLEFANAVPDRLRENVFVHGTALVGHGRFHKGATHIIPGVCAAVLWSRCGRVPGTFEYATVPPLPFDLEQMANVKAIRDVIRDMDEIEAVFAGIGMVKPPKEAPTLKDKLSMTALLHPTITPDELTRQGAVADFSYCLVDAQGCSREFWTYFLTAGYGSAHPDIQFYKHMVELKKKVIVMAGPFKIPALMAGLRGKLFNVLITDEDSARQLATARVTKGRT